MLPPEPNPAPLRLAALEIALQAVPYLAHPREPVDDVDEFSIATRLESLAATYPGLGDDLLLACLRLATRRLRDGAARHERSRFWETVEAYAAFAERAQPPHALRRLRLNDQL